MDGAVVDVAVPAESLHLFAEQSSTGGGYMLSLIAASLPQYRILAVPPGVRYLKQRRHILQNSGLLIWDGGAYTCSGASLLPTASAVAEWM